MTDTKKAEIIVAIEQLRLIESELFRLTSKYGVKTIEELDHLVSKGKLSEQVVGDDLFIFDDLVAKKEKIEKKLAELRVKKNDVWKNLQDLLGLPKLSTRI